MTEEHVRQALRERRANVSPDAGFAARVLARLPRREISSLAWAAWHVLPASLALVAVLAVAVIATHRTPGASPTPNVTSSPSASDPLDWLLQP